MYGMFDSQLVKDPDNHKICCGLIVVEFSAPPSTLQQRFVVLAQASHEKIVYADINHLRVTHVHTVRWQLPACGKVRERSMLSSRGGVWLYGQHGADQ